MIGLKQNTYFEFWLVYNKTRAHVCRRPSLTGLDEDKWAIPLYTEIDLHSHSVTIPAAYSLVYHRHTNSSGKFRGSLLCENRKCCHQRLLEDTSEGAGGGEKISKER